MRPIDLIVQTSLDGFVAGVNGEFDNFIADEENLGFVCGWIEDADAILMGRISFELLEAYWPAAGDRPDASPNTVRYANWYNSVPRLVASETLKSGALGKVFVLKKDVLSQIRKFKQLSGKRILIFGSPTLVDLLLSSDLIDNICLIVHPVLFGTGIPLFKKASRVSHLKLLTSKTLSNGTCCHQYAILKPSSC